MENLSPRGFINLLNYKIAYKLYLFLSYKNHSNIIIHGRRSGKSVLVKSVMQDIYPGDPTKYLENDFNVTIYNNYYIFECSYINNKSSFLEFIKNIIKTYDHYTQQCKYLILDNFEMVNEQLQNSLKVILEKAYYTCKFIIITNQYNKVILPIKSRCIGIRIPLPSVYDKFLYCKTIFTKKDISYNEYNLFKECKEGSIQDIIFQHSMNETVSSLQKEIYDKFYYLVNKPQLNECDITKLRGIVSQIKEVNIPFINIIHTFINTLTMKDQTMDIIQVCNDSNYRIVTSYREIVHIESLIIYLNLLINKYL